MNDKETSRRAFLAAALTAGAALAGCSIPEDRKETELAGEEELVKPSGEMVKLLSVDGEVIEVDKAFLKPVPSLPPVSNEEARVGIKGKKFVMVIDLSRCRSAKKCQESCNHAHELHPGQNWIKIYPMQDSPHTAPYWE